MTTRTQQLSARRWVLSFLAALVAVLATVGLAGSASAASSPTAGTRVGAHNIAVDVLVEPPQSETAGQQLGNDPVRVVGVVATGVAAEAGGARFVVGAGGDVLDTAAVTIPKGKFGYLLENPSKSGVFRDSMGFDQAGLDQALRSHLIDNFGGASGLSPMVGGGSKFSVRGGMTGPSGASWNITSVWGIDTNGTVRLITATP